MNVKKIFNSFWHMYSWRLFNFNGVLLEIFEKEHEIFYFSARPEIYIWLVRNNIIFQEGTANLDSYLSLILHCLFYWLESYNHQSTYSRYDLLINANDIVLDN